MVPDGRVPGWWLPEWKIDGPFFPLVNTYSAALSALPWLTDPRVSFPLGGYNFGFTGKVLESIQVRADNARGRFQMALARGDTGPIELLFNTLTCMLVNAAYESIKDDVEGDESPLIQFFRHIRNGCSHRNRFRFTAREPRLPAAWRGIVIANGPRGDAHPLHGTPVFAQHGLLHCADSLLLLADIEKAKLSGTGGRMATAAERLAAAGPQAPGGTSTSG